MSDDGLSLPEFKKISNQKSITSFFSVISRTEKWERMQQNFEAESSCVPDKEVSQVKNTAPGTSKANKRIVWNNEVKDLAINRHKVLKGTYKETIKDLQRTHPGTVFEALTIPVLARWITGPTKARGSESKGDSAKKGRKTYLPEYLLEEMKSIVDQLLQSRTRIATKPILLQLTAFVQSKGYGEILKVS